MGSQGGEGGRTRVQSPFANTYERAAEAVRSAAPITCGDDGGGRGNDGCDDDMMRFKL